MKKAIMLIVLISIMIVILFSTIAISCDDREYHSVREPSTPHSEEVLQEEQLKKESKTGEVAIEEQNPESENVPDSPESVPESPGVLTVPEGWPLPFNDKIALELSTSRSGDDYTVWQIIGKYPGKGEEIYNWYKSNLGGFSVEVDLVYDKGNNIKGYEYRINNDDLKAALVFEDTSDNQSSVSMYVEKSY